MSNIEKMSHLRSTPTTDATVEAENSEYSTVSYMEMTVNTGAIYMRSEGQETSFDEHDMRLYVPVLAHIQKTLRQQPRLALAADKLEIRSDYSLPFWSNESFGIVLREVLMNSLRSIHETDTRTGSIAIRSEIEKGFHSLRISVIDSGVGLQGHDPKKLFQEGFSTKKQTLLRGTIGNGLSRSREFLKKVLGGTIELLDNASLGERSGATCRITIPL